MLAIEEFDNPAGANKAAVRRAMASTLVQVRKARGGSLLFIKAQAGRAAYHYQSPAQP